MTYSKTLSLLATGAFVITACAPESMAPTSDGPGAGAAVLSQDFGAANMNNMNVQNVKLQMEMVKNLTRIFAAETPATINFAFNSSELDAEAQEALDQLSQTANIVLNGEVAEGASAVTGGDAVQVAVAMNAEDVRVFLRSSTAANETLICVCTAGTDVSNMVNSGLAALGTIVSSD